MSTAAFKETKGVFKPAFRTLAADSTTRNDFLEAAFYAYAHRNPLIDFLFWRRLQVVEQYLLSKKYRSVFDFGCGSGVLSYCLSLSGIEVIATDIEPVPLNEMQRLITFPDKFTFLKPEELHTIGNRRCAAAVALDVLEHTDDPVAEIRKISTYVQPGGEIIICGPTENFLYKIGRFVSGKRFTGAYHKTNIREIRKRATQEFHYHHIATLYPFLPLFEIFSITV